MRSIKAFNVTLEDAETVLENLLSQHKQCIDEVQNVRLTNPAARHQLIANIQQNVVTDVEHHRLWPPHPPVANGANSMSNIEKERLFQFWMDKSKIFSDSSRFDPRITYESTIISFLFIQIVFLTVLLCSFSKINDSVFGSEKQKTSKRNNSEIKSTCHLCLAISHDRMR